jgi:hypothetical protein
MEDYSASVEHSLYLKPQCHPIKELKLLVLNVLTPTEAEMEGLPFIPTATLDYHGHEEEGLTHPRDCSRNATGSFVHCNKMRKTRRRAVTGSM